MIHDEYNRWIKSLTPEQREDYERRARWRMKMLAHFHQTLQEFEKLTSAYIGLADEYDEEYDLQLFHKTYNFK